MTIDLRRVVLALPVLLVAWVLLLAGVMRLSGAAPAALPEGGAVVASGPMSVTVKGGAGLVAALYQAGAVLVLPAGLAGCLPR